MRNAVLSFFMVVGLALTASAPAGPARASLELRKELPATYNTCSGNGCCYDTPRVRGGVGCVRKTWLWTARPLGDDPNATMGEPVQYRLLVGGWNSKTHRRDASGPQLFGLANADNKVVLQPEHRQLVVISATHAISDVGLIDIRRGKVVRPWGPDLRMPMVFESYEETKVFSGTYPSTRRALPAVISVTAERPSPAVKGGKLCDIAFLNAHGERRWLLENTVCTEGPAAKRLSRRMVIDVQNPGEPIRQVFTDFQGNFLSVTGPVEVFRRYGGYSYEIGGSRPAIKAAGREAARRTVDFPNPLDPARRWLYQPLDDHGDPLVLGDRVMGVLPVKVTRYSYEDLYGGWMIVELAADDGLRYRFGTGSAAEVLAQRSSLPLFDELHIAPPLRPDNRLEQTGAPIWADQPQILARIAGGKEWIAIDRDAPGIDREAQARLWRQATGPTRAACGGGAWRLEGRSSMARYIGGPHMCVGWSPEAILAERTRHYAEVAVVAAAVRKVAIDHGLNAGRYEAEIAAERAAVRRAAAVDEARRWAAGDYKWGHVQEIICPVLGETSKECIEGRRRYPTPPPPPPMSIQQILAANMKQYMQCQEARARAASAQRYRAGPSGLVWVSVPGC
ncbi:MAG: hypothetical protein Q8J89_12760 [Caulobacter sp.]|nr:hypothetical protein [Caulobacter sp.]